MGVHSKIQRFALSEKERDELLSYKGKINLSNGNAREAKGAGRLANEAKYQGFRSAKDVTLNHGVNGEQLRRIAS